VPLMERNVKLIYLNNVVGTQNLVALSREGGVERFIGISTDKAVYPVSIMGMTKRICELLYKSAAVEGLKIGAVRFGNVLGSNGSVMTVFRRQIRQGGPLTITSPDMERYFMTIDEATGLVLQAGSMEGRGDVLVLDMGEPIRIQDLAENLIILSGMTPGEDIEIRYTGVREGEKLSEELFHRESFRRKTSCPNITREVVEVDGTLSDRLASIRRDFDAMSEEEMRHAIEDLIGGRKADCVPL
jgi:FlaA1/EpsC-like NDP-sugar epimerase